MRIVPDQCCDCVTETLLVTCTDGVDEAKFKKRVADWFRQAGGRIKSSEKRQDRKAMQDLEGAAHEVLPIQDEANNRVRREEEVQAGEERD